MPRLYPGYKDEIRKKIVREAYPIFLEKGYDGTKMEEIAARLDVTKAAIYRYFRTKDELFFVSITIHVMEEFQETVNTSFKSENLVEAGDAFFDAFLKVIQKYDTLKRDARCAVLNNEALKERVLEYQQANRKILECILTREMRKGHIHPRLDAKDLSHVCLALVSGLVEDVSAGMDPIEVKGIWHRTFAELLQIQKNYSG